LDIGRAVFFPAVGQFGVFCYAENSRQQTVFDLFSGAGFCKNAAVYSRSSLVFDFYKNRKNNFCD
jgi:hypothetical protein